MALLLSSNRTKSNALESCQVKVVQKNMSKMIKFFLDIYMILRIVVYSIVLRTRKLIITTSVLVP